MLHYSDLSSPISKHEIVKQVEEAMFEEYKTDWLIKINADQGMSGRGGNKLRTYCKFKSNYCVEKYCTLILPKLHRSALCKFRCGVAPLRIETGRYEGLPVERRICPFCIANNESVIENEHHVLFDCYMYNDLRITLFEKAIESVPNFSNLNITDKLILLFTDDSLVRILAKTCFLILQRRQFYMCK